MNWKTIKNTLWFCFVFVLAIQLIEHPADQYLAEFAADVFGAVALVMLGIARAYQMINPHTMTDRYMSDHKDRMENSKVEEVSEEIHRLYCTQYEKDTGEPYWTGGDYSKLGEATKEYDRNIARWHHHQLQKARHDWLREEIVRLEGMKVGDRPTDFHGDNDPQWWDECAKGHNSAIETIIDRYQAELDQDKV